MNNIFSVGYYTEHDLNSVPFKSLGKNVLIAKNCNIVGIENISIGNNIRIDPFCSLIAPDNGWINLHSYIHIGGYCFLSGGDGIEFEAFSALSQGGKIYSRSDDYSGEFLTGPTIPKKYLNVTKGPVIIKKHAILGSNCVVFPNITVGVGVAVGALSLVTKNLSDWGIYAGIPAKKIKNRSKNLLNLEKKLLSTENP